MSVKELKVVLHAAICRPDFCILATTRITIGPILCRLQFRQPGRAGNRGEGAGKEGRSLMITGRNSVYFANSTNNALKPKRDKFRDPHIGACKKGNVGKEA